MSTPQRSRTGKPQAAPASSAKKSVKVVGGKIVIKYTLAFTNKAGKLGSKPVTLELSGAAQEREKTIKNVACAYMRLHGLPNVSAAAEKLIEDLLTVGKWKEGGGRDIKNV